MISVGKLYQYKHSKTNEVAVEFRRIGVVDEVRKPGGEWVEISPSVMKANKTSRAVLSMMFEDADELGKFYEAYAALNSKARAVPKKAVDESDELFPVVAEYNKDGAPIYDSRQIMLHCAEKLAMSDPRNTIASNQYFILYTEEGASTYDLESLEFRNLIINTMLQASIEEQADKKAVFMPSGSAVRETLPAILEVFTRRCIVDKSAKMDIRLSSRGDKVIYDTLGAEVYEITASDVKLIDMPKGLIRTKSMEPLGEVDLSASAKDFRLLERHLPYTGFHKLLYMAWLVQMALDNMYEGTQSLVPLVLVTGPQGSSKTSATESTIHVIDPVSSPRAKTLKYDDKIELAIDLSRSKFSIWDNLSGKLARDVSDALCTTVTGGSTQKRKLYSDTLVVDLKPVGRPVMTSMHLAPFASDLAERTLYLEAIKPKQQTSMVKVNKYFRDNGAKIRGAYVKLIQAVLAKHEDRLEYVMQQDIGSRLVEYCAVGDIVAEEFGLPVGTFTSAFKELASEMQQDKAELDSVAQQVKAYVQNNYFTDDRGQAKLNTEQVKSATEWAEAMQIKVNDQVLTARGIVSFLGMAATSLEQLGISWTKAKRTNAGQTYKLSYRKVERVSTGAVDALEALLA